MTHVSKPMIFRAAIDLLPHIAARPLGKRSRREEERAVQTVLSLARRVADLCAESPWAPTIEPLPARVEELTAPRSGKPEWIRLPTRGKCPLTGLSRSGLYQIVAPCAWNDYTHAVQRIVLRRRGAARGTRLISYDSLLTWLASLPSESR